MIRRAARILLFVLAAMPVPDLDALLGGRTSTHKGKLLMGPTGAGLWCPLVEEAPGFCGTYKFMHAFWEGIESPARVEVRVDGAVAQPSGSSWTWSPSHLAMRFDYGETSLDED